MCEPRHTSLVVQKMQGRRASSSATPPPACRARWRVVAQKNRHRFNALGRMGGRQNEFPQLKSVILIVHCNNQCCDALLRCDPQPVGSTEMPFGEEAMKNHCAYCHGKFGLVRHRRAFKSFCSQKCVDHYRTWLRAEVRKRKSWSDCLWLASLNVVPYAGERSSA
jgi:hypothetical protein